MLDTEPLAARAWTEAAAACGVDFDDRVTKRMIGRTFVDCRALLVDHHGVDYPVDTVMAAWGGAYDSLVEREGLTVKPGLVELLDWLEANAIVKVVATSTRHARARAKLEKTGLLRRFAALVGGDDVEHGKPAPDIFLAAIERIDCAPADALVLEDSEAGLIAAARAGIPAIGVPDLADPPDLVLGHPPLVMRSLHDVRVHLASLAYSDR
jgi:HAD superfamily hydrolase (TIGR01509 family)